MKEILQFIVDFVDTLGYPGIFIMTFLESTFMPIPSEITMIPAGYLISQGNMDFTIVMILGTLGTIGGAMFNYWLAYHYGRKLFARYGKYFFMNDEKLKKMEDYFYSHGPISMFLGRLIPGLRHFISFPAGLARMDLKLFTIYTGIGGALWLFILLTLGYYIGENKDELKEYLIMIKGGLVGLVVVAIALYTWRRKVKASRADNTDAI